MGLDDLQRAPYIFLTHAMENYYIFAASSLSFQGKSQLIQLTDCQQQCKRGTHYWGMEVAEQNLFKGIVVSACLEPIVKLKLEAATVH